MFNTTSPITCDFELSHSTRIFYSGDQVCGKITLHTTKKLHLEGISINLSGLESVHWSEHSKTISINYDDSTINEMKSNQIQYKGIKEYLITSLQLSDSIELEPGEFIANFRLTLPTQLLPTCKQTNGNVDYQLQAVLQRKSKRQKIFHKRIILRNRVDLNEQQNLLKPFTITCCELPNNEIKFSIPYTGYVPGQFIPFNLSMTQLLYKAKIIINLCQKIIYKSQIPTQHEKEITKVLDYHIATSNEFSQLEIPLAIEISSTTTMNTLMMISYYLEFLILNENLEVAHRTFIPITIGTVALNCRNENFNVYEQRLLHYYDNLATSKADLEKQEFAFNKLLHFDQVTCEANKCAKYSERRLSGDFKRFFNKIYNKITV